MRRALAAVGGLAAFGLGLAAQLPLQVPTMSSSVPASETAAARRVRPPFELKKGPDVFTPADMLELPRPGAGVPNAAGDLFLVSVSKYSFTDKKNHKSIYLSSIDSPVLPLEIPLASGGDVFWLDSRTVGHVVANEEKGGVQELFAISVKFETEAQTANATVLATPAPPQLVGQLATAASAPASNFVYSAASKTLVFSAYVYEDYDLATVAERDKAYESRGNTAMVLDQTFVRHWDTWQGIKKSALFSVALGQGKEDKWILGSTYASLLKRTGHATPVEPFGGTDDFSVSATHVLYTAKDPKLPEAWHTKQNVYIVDIHGKHAPRELTSGKQGATHSPVLSVQGDRAAWLELDEDGYESDRAKIVVYDLHKDVRFTLTQDWDRSPDSLAFSHAGDILFFTAGDEAKVKVFAIVLPPTPESSTTHPELPSGTSPSALTSGGAANGLYPLPDGRVIFSRNSLTRPNDVHVLGIAHDQSWHKAIGSERRLTDFASAALAGKALHSGEEVWFEGAEGRQVHGWVITPPGFESGAKAQWPAILLIHGGPQGAWEDSWSTRWNPNVWAQQGYVIVAINPTGSTTFGQEFTDAIAEDWGGRPFVDLQKGWKYVLEKYPEIDHERLVAAGASWGGYAINWIQGHPEFDFGFKALFCHDGVFDSNYNGYSTDELFFFNHEWGGQPWSKKSRELSTAMSPSSWVHKWSTPQLIVHGSKDYRLPDTEGIAAFHALQQRGVPSRLVVFPDENHWVLNHGNSLKWHYEVFRWFDEWVG